MERTSWYVGACRRIKMMVVTDNSTNRYDIIKASQQSAIMKLVLRTLLQLSSLFKIQDHTPLIVCNEI